MYRIDKHPGLSTTTYLTIEPVRVASIMRLVTQSRVLDIDLYLYEGNDTNALALAFALNFDDDFESLLFRLEANTQYTVKLIHYRFGSNLNDAPCYEYMMNLVRFKLEFDCFFLRQVVCLVFFSLFCFLLFLVFVRL